MNHSKIVLLKSLRKVYASWAGEQKFGLPDCELNCEIASELIFSKLSSERPCMIARFGAFELNTVVNYLGTKQFQNVLSYIKGKSLPWWWDKKLLEHLQNNAGFFPNDKDSVEKFCELMLEDAKQLDILGSWLDGENHIDQIITAPKVHLRLLEPFWSLRPWTEVLKGKRILVIHPFVQTIQRQYEVRGKLFMNENVLPQFGSFHLIKAVQSSGGEKDHFNNWFDALESMKSEMGKVDFDICLIGAGAYGFPLAAHAKRLGKKAVHLGGSLQLLFGIKGKRWENPMYGVNEWGIPQGTYSSLMNEYWVRPNENEKPPNASTVEGACYW